MTNQPSGRRNRSYATLAAAIVVAAVVIAATLSATLETNSTVTKTTTQTTTTIETTTLLISSSQTGTTPLANTTCGPICEVTFQQVRYCGKFNILPWAVTLDGQTEVQPSNQSLPLPGNTFSTLVPNQNLTRMTFLVPLGSYNYTIEGGSGFNGFYPTSGAVQVNGSDVLVNVGISLSITC
jgi:hypothetical protein